ncbi:MAG: hypothetical protein DRQ49_03085 [Gammaproteobacteria bacterium]|nr:MAG: hypothetical protein DRQ49_03085 [Gammaproteobacteria bacterium]RKZ45153.1 MAG: hypothetical protein DRQ41_00955 [Gammaproteobacteria bacterium]RKZ75496.1 MAG: hypothetical protein DRQ57_07245 [Gammaproteobacteria bacterium]
MKKLVLSLMLLTVSLVWAYAFETQEKNLQALAQEADVIAAMKAFSETFGQFRADNGLESVDELKTSVFSYYDNEFAPEYQKITGNAPDLKMAKSLGDDTIAFQYHYISTNKNLLGEKNKLDRAADKSKWSAAHAIYHSKFRDYVKGQNLYDLFLVDLKGNVVYTVFKEIDFATSLVNGPYALSGLGGTFDSMKKAPKGFVSTGENSTYFPSYMKNTNFVGAPLYDGDNRVGTVIVQLQSWAEELVLGMAQRADVITAMKDLSGSFGQFQSDNSSDSVADMKQSVFSYYDVPFATEYENTTGEAPDLTKAKSLDDNAIALQYYYISANKSPMREKQELDDAKDKSKWSKVHAQHNPTFRNEVDKHELYDLSLIDLEGHVVYTVFKEIEFATNLVNGAYADSPLGHLFKSLKEADKGVAKTGKNAPYFPSFGDNAEFVGTSIYEGDKKIGILVIQLPSW